LRLSHFSAENNLFLSDTKDIELNEDLRQTKTTIRLLQYDQSKKGLECLEKAENVESGKS
jgi:hypothetical protein